MSAPMCEFVHAPDKKRPAATWVMVGASRTFHICDEHHDMRPAHRRQFWTRMARAS